jgi:hypothetical protein
MAEDLTPIEEITVTFRVNQAGKIIDAVHPEKGGKPQDPCSDYTDATAIAVTKSSPGKIYIYAMGKWWCIEA